VLDSADDEQVCLRARRHGAILARPLATALGLFAVGLFALTLPWWPATVAAALAMAAGAVLALRHVWRWEHTQLVVTTEKLFVVHGTVRRRAAAVRLRSVHSLEMEQGLLGRILGYGTLVCGPLEVSHVARPRQVFHLVERLCG
jgi:membrane protein YdbS with pleckstrin-like domain